MIRIFQPTLGQEELDAIGEVFAGQWPGTGPRVKAFERAFAEYIGVECEHMIAVTSCTEGLFQAVATLEPTPSTEVIVPTISFIGAAHAVRGSSLTLRLIDVDPLTLNPRPEQIEEAFTSNTRAILLLHFGGRLEWIQEIAELARRRNVLLIEDTACALGGKQDGASYGTFGDIGVWSFDAMKLLVTGDGGMIRVGDETLRRKIFNRVYMGGATTGLENAEKSQSRWWEVNPPDWGRRSYMNDLAAAIGLVQLRRVEHFKKRRWQIAKVYNQAFEAIPWLKLPPPAPEESVPYFYWIQTSAQIRDNLATYLRNCEIYTTFRYWPLHRTTLYADGGYYPGADLASNTTLLLPVHQNLSDYDVSRVIDSICDFKP
ncbi:MAG: DegT/DnrJ/EryC1/StrS family aminotransferase [Blastocatellia bacterium]